MPVLRDSHRICFEARGMFYFVAIEAVVASQVSSHSINRHKGIQVPSSNDSYPRTTSAEACYGMEG